MTQFDSMAWPLPWRYILEVKEARVNNNVTLKRRSACMQAHMALDAAPGVEKKSSRMHARYILYPRV